MLQLPTLQLMSQIITNYTPCQLTFTENVMRIVYYFIISLSCFQRFAKNNRMSKILENNSIHIVSKKIEHKIVHKKTLIQKHASQACLILNCFYAILGNQTSFKGCLPAKTETTPG